MTYKIEHAATDRAHCVHCKGKIEKDQLRVGMAGESRWHHVSDECVSHRLAANIAKTGVESMDGYGNLKKTEQHKIKKIVDEMAKQGAPAAE